MSSNHLLVQRAFTYDARTKVEDPEGCRYDDILGAWLLGNQEEFLVKSDDRERPRPTTKKQNQETGGEDLKGA